MAAVAMLLTWISSPAEVRQPFVPLDESLVLSQSSVQTMAQDQDGYLWIGTQGGLDRYDGYRIESWQADPDDPGSLSHNFIRDLLVTRDNALWVATGSGPNRLDAETRAVTRFAIQTDDGNRVASAIVANSLVEDANGDVYALAHLDAVRPVRWQPGQRAFTLVPITGASSDLPVGMQSDALIRDAAGRIWMANPSGLWRLDRTRDRFARVIEPSQAPPARWMGGQIAAPGPDNGIVYASTDGLYRVDPDAEEPIRLLRPTENGLRSDWVRSVATDSRGAIWFVQPGLVVRIDPVDGSWRSFDKPHLDPRSAANSGYHRLRLEETRDGSVWLAGLFGVARYDHRTRQMDSFLHDPNDPASLPPTLGEIGYTIFRDRFDVLWVGGNLGGLAKLEPQGQRFVHVSDRTPTPTSRNIVRAIAEQTVEGETFVWTARQNKGIVVWRQTGPRSYERAFDYPADGTAGEFGVVREFVVDPVTNQVWIIGRGGIGRVRKAGEPLERLTFEGAPGNPVGMRVAAFIDPTTLAVASGIVDGPEIWRIDTQTLAVSLLDASGKPGSERASFEVFDLFAGSNGTLALATSRGLSLIDGGDGTTSWHAPLQRTGERPENYIFSVVPDGSGGYWMGTRGGGLLRAEFLAQDQPVFRRYTTEHGLPDNTVYAVVRTDAGMLWLSTNRGVASFDPQAETFRRYTPGDGLQAWEFNHAVAHRGDAGRLYFGGINGWNVFVPENIQPLEQPPLLDLDALRVNGRPLQPAIDDTLSTLAHDQNQLTIDYVGLHFAAPERIRYAYRLFGVDEDWIDAGSARSARYPELSSGAYRFELRAQNLDGVWSDPETLLRFEIARAPWATPWAYSAYGAVLAALILVALARQRRTRRLLQAEVARQTEEVQRQNELIADQARELEQALAARTTLFANISHEFRTPLTLIEASIERLERDADPQAATTGRRYLARLLRLVEQLLDLSRLGLTRSAESDTPWRLDSVVSQTVEAFRSVSERRGIEIHCCCEARWQIRCSQELIEKILLNLLANAVKFTPAGGTIRVSLEPQDRGVELVVADSGPGIAETDQQRIFERFYRSKNDGQDRQPGAGIGLALVFEAARAVGGKVRVDSEPGQGARFSVSLPAVPGGSADAAKPLDENRRRLDLALLEPLESRRTGLESDSADAPAGALLVVEDNADLRRYIRDSLSSRWRIIEAEDGEAGYSMARDHDCDIIVSDLMMPRADGFEMLEKLRGDIRTSHIPVLFLTARQDEETRLRAFSLSADAFLPKPFKREELLTRLEQVVDSRRRLREHIHRSHGFGPPNGSWAHPPNETSRTHDEASRQSPISARDRDFLAALNGWLEDHHGDPDITIGDLAEALHLTPRTLQRKLRSLADRTPAAYLREYRMARARDWLQNSGRPVTDIAFCVGYSSSQYFSRAFRELHGEPPEAWRQRHARDADARSS